MLWLDGTSPVTVSAAPVSTSIGQCGHSSCVLTATILWLNISFTPQREMSFNSEIGLAFPPAWPFALAVVRCCHCFSDTTDGGLHRVEVLCLCTMAMMVIVMAVCLVLSVRGLGVFSDVINCQCTAHVQPFKPHLVGIRRPTVNWCDLGCVPVCHTLHL